MSRGWRVPHRGEVRRTGAACPRDRRQDERIASESVEDVPSVDELLVAETFYGGRG